MKRLTYKLDEPIETKYLHYDYKRIADYDISRGNYGRITDADIYNKLGQLEDIEEKLGIDLITLFKAVKNGIYRRSGKKYEIIRFIPHEYLVFDSKYLYELKYCVDGSKINNDECPVKWERYGKTFALTKEELERRKNAN